MRIRIGSVAEAVDLAKRIPDFSNPYNLNSPDAVLPELDHVLIAEEDGMPVGFRAGSRFSPDTFAVWLAGVLPEFRTQGIGGALYRCQKEWLKSQGYRFIRTHARNSNRVMLKILIENGYQVVDVVSYGDVQRNKVVFVKNLWEQDAPMTAGALIIGLLRAQNPLLDPDLQAWLRDITISWVRFEYSGRIIEDSSVDAILDRAVHSGHKYCLILTHGTIVSQASEPGWVQTIEAWASQHAFLAAGEIVARDDSCHGILPGGLLVDLARYRDLSKPAYGETRTSPVEVALPAPPVNGAVDETVTGSLQPSGKRALARPGVAGWNLVSASLAAGIAVESLPEAVSSTFLDIAPENSQQAESVRGVLGDAIATGQLDPRALGAGQLKFLSAVQRQVQNTRRGIFVWTFGGYEEVNHPPADFEAPVSTIYSVAAGLKTSWILQTHGFDDATRVVYFDDSRQALEFKRLQHEQWNGEDYPEFLRHLFKKIQPGEALYQIWGGFSPQDIAWDTIQDAWTREIARWGGESVIKEHWRRAKQLRVDYVLCNVLEDQGPLIHEMDNRPHSVIWWSHVFFTVYNNWFYTIDQRRAIYERFIRGLTQRSPNTLMYGNDYNNIAVNAIRAAEYSKAYFRTEENYLEPRKIPG